MHVPRVVRLASATAFLVSATWSPLLGEDEPVDVAEPVASFDPETLPEQEIVPEADTLPEQDTLPEPVASFELITVSNGHGAAITFTETEGLWRWTRLISPDSPEEGWAVADLGGQIATATRGAALAADWALVDAAADHVVFEQDAAATGLRVRRVFGFGAAPNALRIETWVQSLAGGNTITHIDLLNLQIPGQWFRETGTAPASFPLFGESLFAGIEHVSGEAHTSGDTIELAQRPRLAVDETWQLAATSVVGWPLPGMGDGLPDGARMREAFLRYLDPIRIKPERMVLHSETWWTLPPPLWEKDVLNDIEALRRGFHERTGMFFDTYALDLGWSDPRSLWRIETRRFPNEFRTINDRLAALGCRLGLWMSPGSGYPDGLSNAWLQSQGYELTPFPGLEPGAPCFALGTRYQREFRERIVAYAQQYGLGHLILDFMALQCDVASHGHPIGPESRYAIDAGLADVLDSVRAASPNIALEPMVCGYPPSPWWLMKTPFILGPAGDDLPYGRVPCPEWMESLITARDIAYRESQEAWLMPTQALETWDVIVQTPGEFENTAVMAIGRGRWFISSYIRPELMKPEDWDFFAALIRWARHNKQFLENAWMIGGSPADREAYGYMFRHPEKELYCVRNPWIEERSIELPGLAAAAEPRELRMIYPRRATLARIEPGAPGPRIVVGPYETLFLETVPAGHHRRIFAAREGPEFAAVTAAAPRLLTAQRLRANEEENGIRYYWEGALSLPGIEGAELCILVEGGPEVERALCKVMLDGREAKVSRSESAGQFGAAMDPSPDNWTWFIVPVAKGDTTFQVDLTVLAEEASIGVFLRGFAPAFSAPEPENGPVFPVFNPRRRAWSQTLVPLKPFVSGMP